MCLMCWLLIPQQLFIIPIWLSPGINVSKIFLTNTILAVFHPKPQQSHLIAGQIRGLRPSDPRLLLPPGKRAVSQREQGEQEALAAGQSQRKGSGRDRKRNTHWLERAWEGGGRSTQVPKYAIVTPCMKMYFSHKSTVRIYRCLHVCKYFEFQTISE